MDGHTVTRKRSLCGYLADLTTGKSHRRNNLDDENKLLHRDKLDNKNMFDNLKPPYS
jgi:hypothetical protein